ncbi:hypothetical protein [Maioricimonas sp. JC845]|uniref:hypothetical protein n=1 Tax=Maioricimonas sp. JC845 TaxID=3232138 RepID=UPI00345767E3
MNAPFPFGFPWPTAFYLTLYVVTFAIHVAFMHYVIAGSSYLVTVAVRNRPVDPDRRGTLLRDWMPLMLSAAITAGVAPLLFVQILYQKPYYTANLLLFNRWMAILPALIVGFYLLYLLKSPLATRRGMWLRVVITAGAFGCFFFTGWSWTENHLLSLQSNEVWAQHYAEGRTRFWTITLIPRLITWFAAAFPTLAIWLAWQIRLTADDDTENHATVIGRLALTAWIGMAISVIAGIVLLVMDPPEVRQAVLGIAGIPWMLLGIAGVAAQAIGWWQLRGVGRLCRSRLTIISAGCSASILAGAVLRELMRISRLDIAAFYPKHAAAAEVGGLVVFLFFFAVNAVIIGYCIWLVRSADQLAPTDDAPAQDEVHSA